MRQFTIFHPWVMSFYSKALYQDVANHWRGIGLRYLLLLLMACCLYPTYQFNAFLKTLISEMVVPIIEQLPEITIVEGETHINAPVPYFIFSPATKDMKAQTLAIIDTSGKYTSLDKTTNETDARVLLTKTRFYFNDQDPTDEKSETKGYDLSRIKGTLIINKDKASKNLSTIKNASMIMSYPAGVILFFMYRLIQALVYSIAGLLFAAILKMHLPYGMLLRLVVVSMTPSIILGTFFSSFSIQYPHQLLSYFLLSMLYLFFAVFAQKDHH